MRNSQKIEFDQETGKQKKIPKQKKDENGKIKIVMEVPEESVLETDGTNLAKIFEVDEVDFTRTISNDINEIYQVLGIEAVRKSLLRELRMVLKPYGIYVNYRHISILCDLMTQRGILTSITRHGLNRGEYGPIRKATFEETVEILLEAGIFSERDDLKGISENVLLGKLTKIGTGCFDLLVDIDAFENENKNNDMDYPNDDERMLNSEYEANDGQTPVISTPGYGFGNNIPMSVYDNSVRFTPAHDNNPSSIQSPFHNPGSFYKDTFLSSPEQGKNAPSSPEYNPQSDYYKTPAPYSPQPIDEGNRVQSQYGVSAYSPTMSPGFNSGTGVLLSRPLQTNRGINSSYSPTTPGYLKPSSSSPQYIQGSGSGLYNSTPKVQGSGNTSQYHPASPGYYPTSPSYNIKAIDNASPFYKQEKDEDEEEEEEENNDEDDDKNNN